MAVGGRTRLRSGGHARDGGSPGRWRVHHSRSGRARRAPRMLLVWLRDLHGRDGREEASSEMLSARRRNRHRMRRRRGVGPKDFALLL
jgi:hypothetical protein